MAKRKKHFNTAKMLLKGKRKEEMREVRHERKRIREKKKLAEREIQRNDGIQK